MRTLLFLLVATMSVRAAQPVFDEWFENKTMRIDYTHSGDVSGEQIALEAVYEEGSWPGRTVFLIDTLNLGQYAAQVFDLASGTLIYSTGFSSVYGEWETTDEARHIRRAISETVRIPYPERPIRFELNKRDRRNRSIPLWSVDIDPQTRSINREKKQFGFRCRKAIDNGDPHAKIDLLIMGDGFTRKDRALFDRAVKRYIDVLFSVSPFKERRHDFNVWVIESLSAERGIDNPRSGQWRYTLLGMQYNAFDVDRYVLSFDNKALRDVASLVPYDLLYVIINSPKYGGGGIFNQYAVCYSGREKEQPDWWADYVFVHEFGHLFAGLADEYYSSEVAYNDLYPLDVEPWEPNITTLADERIKWENLLTPGVAVPTPWAKAVYDSLTKRVAGAALEERLKISAEMKALLHDAAYEGVVGCFEGAGYASEGIYRPAIDCRMFSKSLNDFCPVCRNAIERMIDFIIGKPVSAN